jgi:HAD superfamily hydrolase (TIGR01509 family)
MTNSPGFHTNARSGQAKYRAALMDLDDTIFDHQLHRREALAAVRAAIPSLAGAGIEELERIHDLHLQRTHRALLANVLTLDQARTERLHGMLSDFGCPAGDDEIAIAESAYRAAYDRQWRAVPGARELIRRLRELGVLIAVITNGRILEQTAKIRALELNDAIDHVFASEAVGAEKPARAFFEHVMGRLSVSCAQCVVVGDLWETDIRGALDSDMDAIWLNRYGRTCAASPRVREITSLEPTDGVVRMFLQPSP